MAYLDNVADVGNVANFGSNVWCPTPRRSEAPPPCSSSRYSFAVPMIVVFQSVVFIDSQV